MPKLKDDFRRAKESEIARILQKNHGLYAPSFLELDQDKSARRSKFSKKKNRKLINAVIKDDFLLLEVLGVNNSFHIYRYY